MRRTEKRTSEPQEYEATVSVSCGFCGREAPQPSGGGSALDNGDVWGRGSGAINAVTISRTTGASWGGDGGHELSTIFDCCPGCWDSEVVPWLESRGVQPFVKEREW